jgi:hypothetical protein
MTWWINHVGMFEYAFQKRNKLAKGSNGQRVIYHRYISECRVSSSPWAGEFPLQLYLFGQARNQA